MHPEKFEVDKIQNGRLSAIILFVIKNAYNQFFAMTLKPIFSIFI